MPRKTRTRNSVTQPVYRASMRPRPDAAENVKLRGGLGCGVVLQ